MVVVVGAALVVFGLVAIFGGSMYSDSNWAWTHRDSKWNTAPRLEGHDRQVRAWKGAFALGGVFLIAIGIYAIAAGA